jgi:hypothetical protein
MKNRCATLLLVLSCLAFAEIASATDLNFDDINTFGGVVGMPTGYGGFNWPLSTGVWGFVQPPYNAETPPNRVLFNFSCCTHTENDVFSNIGSITFDGAYISGFGTEYFNLYLRGTLVATSGSLNASPVPTFLPSGYSGAVDEIGIIGPVGFFAMDDFTFNAVPEPGTLAMFGSSVLGIACLVRRKFRL